jgi:hypothetical protein
MSYLLSFLRSAALAAATLLLAVTSPISGTFTATAIAVTAATTATFVTASDAEARPRPRVRDHRNGCRNLPNRNYCPYNW